MDQEPDTSVSFLQQALDLAKAGFHVFPLIENGKLPLIDGWQRKATMDSEQIRRWWIDPITGWEQPFNIGISTSHFTDNRALVVVDVDNKDGKSGDDSVLQHELEGRFFPDTYTQDTPTGGKHFVYVAYKAVKQGVSVLGSGLDIRSRGGYIVAAGSVTPKGQYRGTSRKVPIICPEWIIQECGLFTNREQPENVNNHAKSEHVDVARAIRRGTEYLINEAPIAREGQRNDFGFRAAARLKDFGVPEDECLFLMLNYWRCEPGLDDAEIEHVVHSAYRYGQVAPGTAAPETQFSAIAEMPTSTEMHPFECLNKDYAFVVAGGGHHILWETVDTKGNFKLEHMAEPSFHRKHAAWQMMVGDKVQPVTKLWMSHKDRRSYDGICFMPGKQAPAGFYNLWRGFAVEPSTNEESSEAHWALNAWLEHAKDNVCQGRQDLYHWLLGFFAAIVQKPGEKNHVALVLRGGKGVGKNALIDFGIRGILGSHSMIATDRRFLASHFNGHLENLLLLVLDEAFWSGDKQAEGILKGLITGTEHNIEHKGKEPYPVDNHCRVIVIGNEDWLVPASRDERRYAVFDVGAGRRGDRVFFERMRLGMQAGGYRLLLRFLLDFDTSQVDLNTAPDTEALMDQKIETLNPVEQWWLDCLTAGYLVGSDFPGQWAREVDKTRLRIALGRYLKDRNIKTRLPDERSMGKTLRKLAPSVCSTKRREGTGTVHVYKFGPLDTHRQEWGKYMGGELGWELSEIPIV